MDEAGSVILTQTNDGNGQVTFDAITYNEPGEYHYTIREKAGNDPTITYTDKELKVTVTVTEEDSQLIAKAVYEGNQVFWKWLYAKSRYVSFWVLRKYWLVVIWKQKNLTSS